MHLTLDSIGKKVGRQTWLYPMSLQSCSGSVTVLLGATQTGKTSLTRIMAGLDAPTDGNVPVRQRNVSMLYQQFINYPSLKVRDNIASPLKLSGEKNVAQRVDALARKLHIEMFLDRYPSELSGGQQQRVALARALAKGATAWLYAQFVTSTTVSLKKSIVCTTFIRDSDIRSDYFTKNASKYGGLIEFCRSPVRVGWTPPGTNVSDYPKLAQLFCKNVAVAVAGEKIPHKPWIIWLKKWIR